MINEQIRCPDESRLAASETALHSPVQEHHIDFLLEEEFSCNPDFLGFFVDAAKKRFGRFGAEIADDNMLQPCLDWNCKAVRSVTTEKGETDVLVIYHSQQKPYRIAILVENKIRAEFQRNQAARYRQRGTSGKSSQWDCYWTCLVCPEKYAPDNMGFDTRVSLEKLAEFFAGEDARSIFKRRVMQQALKHFASSGPQIKDEPMTRFRAFYAEQAAAFFSEGEVIWPKARDAWWGDSWFNFKEGGIPKAAEIVHKAPAGFVDLAFPNRSKGALERALAKCQQTFGIRAEQTGKSASFRLDVAPISDFSNPIAARATILAAFQRVRDLLAFYKLNRELVDTELASERDQQR